MHFKFSLILHWGIILMTGNIHSALLCAWQSYNPVVQFLSHVQLSVIPWTAAHQASLSFTIFQSPLSRWCYPTISPSAITFSFCLKSFPASRSFPMNQLVASGDLNIGASASASVLPMNIESQCHLGLTALISLLSKGLSRVFSSTTFGKYQLFSTQPSLWSSSYIRIWLLEEP